MHRLLPLAWLVCLPILTASRVQVWQSDLTLWPDALRSSPAKPRPNINYARAIDVQRGQYTEARVYYQYADRQIDRRPTQSPSTLRLIARADAAHCLTMTGDYDQARRELLDLFHTGRYGDAMLLRYYWAELQLATGRCTTPVLPSPTALGQRTRFTWTCPAVP